MFAVLIFFLRFKLWGNLYWLPELSLLALVT